jgi:hypothetical protein
MPQRLAEWGGLVRMMEATSVGYAGRRHQKHWVDCETCGRRGGDGNAIKKKSSSKDGDQWLIYFGRRHLKKVVQGLYKQGIK